MQRLSKAGPRASERERGPDLSVGEPGYPVPELTHRAGWGSCAERGAGLIGGHTSPGAAWPGVDMKVPIRIVLQAADGAMAAEEGTHRAHVASDAEIDGIAGQMA